MSKRRLMTDPRLSAAGTAARRAAQPVQPRPLTALMRMSALAVVLTCLAGVLEVHAGCIDGKRAKCSSGGQAGEKECINGRWGPCEIAPDPEPPPPAPPPRPGAVTVSDGPVITADDLSKFNAKWMQPDQINAAKGELEYYVYNQKS